VTHFLILLLILGGVAAYCTTPEEKARFLKIAKAIAQLTFRIVTLQDLQEHPFYGALHGRTKWAVITPAICVLNVLVFLIGPDISTDDPLQTLNGQWWRLATSVFVHSGFFHLLVNLVGLLQLGLILERIVGSIAFASVYMAAGIATAVIGVLGASAFPGSAASGAALGIYGLFLAVFAWTFGRSDLAISLDVAKRLAPAAAMFILFNILTGRILDAACVTALAIGFCGGFYFCRDISDDYPAPQKVATVLTASIAMAAAYGALTHQPIQQLTDVKAEIERVISVEARTSHAYDETVDRYKKGRGDLQSLADAIDKTILPEIRAVSARLKALDSIPPEQKPLVVAAQQYLHLRGEGWQLRAQALRASNIDKLREADRKEQASLDAFQQLVQKSRSMMTAAL
jgi:membrane associated rhomboid family serine protease